MISAAPISFAPRITADDVALAFRAAGCRTAESRGLHLVRGRTPAGIELTAQRHANSGEWRVTGRTDDGQGLVDTTVARLRDLGELLRAVDRHVADRGLA